MKTTLIPLLLLALFLGACASRPLSYDEMDPAEHEAEMDLQVNIRNTAETIASAGFRFIDDNERRTEIADQVMEALLKAQDLIETEGNRELIDEVLAIFKQIDDDIRETAQDAFDLFAGWIDLPNLNEVLPEVIRDRLAAFVAGGITGLRDYVSTE